VTEIPIEMLPDLAVKMGILVFLICFGFGVMWYLTGKGFENYKEVKKRGVAK